MLDMSTAKTKQKARPLKVKPVPPPKKPKSPDIGPDGMTLTQRLHMLMTERNIGQTELAKRCSEYYATFVPAVDEKVKQQHIWNLINKEQDSAECLVLVAMVLDVNPLWLQFGIGKKER